MDIYQERYIKHQESKKRMAATLPIRRYSDSEIAPLFDIMYNRRSQRLFNENDISDEDLVTIINAAHAAPSSCDRRAVTLKVIKDKPSINQLSGLLVGGSGWIQNANIVILLLADMAAYKSKNEVDFMLYLDAGVIAQNIYLACEAISVGACMINPNIREENVEQFYSSFVPDGHKLCASMALGLYDFREAKRV